jgi:hypothetical protein
MYPKRSYRTVSGISSPVDFAVDRMSYQFIVQGAQERDIRHDRNPLKSVSGHVMYPYHRRPLIIRLLLSDRMEDTALFYHQEVFVKSQYRGISLCVSRSNSLTISYNISF